jgi:hypothetical protein
MTLKGPMHIPAARHASAHYGALASPQVTLKAEPSRCLLRGDALKHAVARQPMSFDIEFVDNLGQVRITPEEAPRCDRDCTSDCMRIASLIRSRTRRSSMASDDL